MKNITVSYEFRGKPRKRKVAAKIVDPLAYHPTIGEKGFWTVTHLASGHAIHRFILSCKQAREIAEKLAGIEGDAWTCQERPMV